MKGLGFEWFMFPESHFFKKKVTVNSLAQTRSPPVFPVSSSGPKPAVAVVRPTLWWAQATPRGWAGPHVVARGHLSHWEDPCPGRTDPLQPGPLQAEHVNWTALFTLSMAVT